MENNNTKHQKNFISEEEKTLNCEEILNDFKKSFGIEIYNHSKRVVLENICYTNHNSSTEQLECCLKAEYIWNEGFSFLNETPSNCNKFMNWND